MIWCSTDRFTPQVKVDIHYSFIKHLKLSKVAHTLLCSGPLSPFPPFFFIPERNRRSNEQRQNDTKKTTHQINISLPLYEHVLLLVYSLLTDTNNLTLNQAQLVHNIYTHKHEKQALCPSFINGKELKFHFLPQNGNLPDLPLPSSSSSLSPLLSHFSVFSTTGLPPSLGKVFFLVCNRVDPSS